MELGTHVWLRSNKSEWGWLPAIITKKENIVVKENNNNNNNAESSYRGGISPDKKKKVKLVRLTLQEDPEDGEGNHEISFFNKCQSGVEWETQIIIDPEQLKTADHDDIKLRNLSSVQLPNAITSPTSMKISRRGIVGGVHDLIGLTHLHEPAILHALRLRYNTDIIYTATGPILIAVNPFKACRLYTEEMMESYRFSGEMKYRELSRPSDDDDGNSSRRRKERIKLPPHVYQIADDSYRAMMRTLEDSSLVKDFGYVTDQSILVSGESGAGKTVTTKIVLTYFAMLSRNVSRNGRGKIQRRDLLHRDSSKDLDMSIEQQVLQSNPIMESFGNARTLRNDNSSRFGKYIDVRFTNGGKLSGASIQTYLLEKVRLIIPGMGERNYHIFYQFLESASANERNRYQLDNLTVHDFKLLNQTGTYNRRDGVSDKDSHKEMLDAMSTIGFPQDTTNSFLRLVSAILFFGNMTFDKMDGAHHESSSLNKDRNSLAASSLIGVTFEDLAEKLTTQKISAGKAFESFTKELNLVQATKGMEAIMKALYGAMFDFLVDKINDSIEDSDKGVASIGVLDIFGFESFEKNGFEQLCINFTNEALQQQFNKYVFKMEQVEYEKEGIMWKFIEFPDNQDVLDLIDTKHVGLLAMLDDQCYVPNPSNQQFTRILYQKFSDSGRFQATSTQKVNNKFTLHHYAGPVEYVTENWIEKNKDELPPECGDLLLSSEFGFLSQVLQPYFRISSTKSKSRLVKKSVGAQFALQLKQLRARIDLTTPHYIRCLKPNDDLVPNRFEPKNVVEQLRCGGVLEAVRVSRAGYPTRFSHDVFFKRYGVFLEKDMHIMHIDGVDDDEMSKFSDMSVDLVKDGSLLKKLVSKIAFQVWEEEHIMHLKMKEAEHLRRHLCTKSFSQSVDSLDNDGSSTPYFSTPPRNTRKAKVHQQKQNGMVKPKQCTDPDRPDFCRPTTEEEFFSLSFNARCAVAGIQLGRTKIFIRREAFDRIEAIRSRRYYKHAVVIQTHVRKFLNRAKYKATLLAIIKMQSFARMVKAHKTRLVKIWTIYVLKIQAGWRMKLARKAVKVMKLRNRRAATVIQRFVREKYGWSYRNIASVVKIQSWIRGVKARAYTNRVHRGIVTFQAVLRGVYVRSKILNARDKHDYENYVIDRLHEYTEATPPNTMTPRKMEIRKQPFELDPEIAVQKNELYKYIELEEWPTVERLLDKNPKLAEEVEPSSGELPLHNIARHNGAWTLLVDMVIVLHPRALVHRDRIGALPMHHAAAHDNVQALNIIYDAYKEGVVEVDKEGRLPLHVAAEFDAIEAVKFLLSKSPEGAYTMILCPLEDSGGGLPLHVACRNYASIGVITSLLAENFASAKRTDENGDLPLHLLLRCGQYVDKVVVKTLLTCFSQAISRTDMNGDLPLIIALKHGCKDSVVQTLLVQNPAAASGCNGEGQSPLFLALECGAEDRAILALLNHAPEQATIRDKKTDMLPIEVATKNEYSPFIVHNLLKRDMPIDLKEKIQAQLQSHNHSWNHLVTNTGDMYHQVINKILQNCTQPQVLALAHVEGRDGKIALAAASPVSKYELRVMLRLFNTLEVVNQKPAYTNPLSDTQIFYALRYDPPATTSNNFSILHEDKKDDAQADYYEDWDDTSHYSSNTRLTSRSLRSNRSQQSIDEKLKMIRKEKGQQVIAKLTSRADVVERELRVRKDYNLSRHYIPAVISVHHTVQHAAYSEAMAEPGYCITMEGADTTAENLILDLRKSGKAFPIKALKKIGVSLLHMHEHGIVHCDFGTHNIGKFGSRWKLLGVGASVPIGQMTDPQRGFYHPPEAIHVESRKINLGKKQVNASVISLPAQPTYDVWSFGVIVYESLANQPLAPYACRGKRQMNNSEVAKIGKWDETSLKKALKHIDSDKLDSQAKSFVKKILHWDPKKRFTSMRKVLEHPFFEREKSSSSKNSKPRSLSATRNRNTNSQNNKVHQLQAGEPGASTAGNYSRRTADSRNGVNQNKSNFHNLQSGCPSPSTMSNYSRRTDVSVGNASDHSSIVSDTLASRNQSPMVHRGQIVDRAPNNDENYENHRSTDSQNTRKSIMRRRLEKHRVKQAQADNHRR